MMHRFSGFIIVSGLALVITLVNQFWVGNNTIYSEAFGAIREQAHYAILNHQLPEEMQSKYSPAFEAVNTRFLTVWTVALIHEVTGLSVNKGYMIVETAGVFISCIFLFYFLRFWGDPLFAGIGLLYFGVILPLTYQLHYFHPWDKLSFAMWLLSLMLMRTSRLLLLVPVLIVGMLVKYDLLLIPTLYFLAFASKSEWKKPLLTTAALFLVTIGTYNMLLFFTSGIHGMHPIIFEQVIRNFQIFADLGLRYPPLLALCLPVLLASYGFSKADRFAKAAVVFCCIQFSVLFLKTNFEEFRAEMPLLILLMPAAITGLFYLNKRWARQ